MKFAEAIERCINGARITRRDWNGKGMFVYYTPGRRIPSKEWTGSIEYKEIQQGYVEVAGHFDMFNAQGIRIIGWLASQTDMASDQWEEAE